MLNKLKLIIKSKYFYAMLIVVLFLSLLSPCIFNIFLAKEEDLINILNEHGIHYYSIFIVLICVLWCFFVYCLGKLCNKIEKIIKENKDE